MKNLFYLFPALIYFSSCNYSQKTEEKNIAVIRTDTSIKKKEIRHRLKNRTNCFCDRDTLMNEATIACDTTRFSNQSTIYWQYNCDKIWLTLENRKKEKFIIDTVSLEYYGYTYRLGYHLIKEFKSGLLFRSGCPANGPCIYTLIDKYDGKVLDKFNQLICIEKSYNAPKYSFNFIVYFSYNGNHLIVEYLDKKKRLKIPFKDKLTAAVPEQQFDEMILENDVLILKYFSNRNTAKILRINLNDKNYLF